MFLDASVIVAIIAQEPGYEAFARRIGEAQGTLFTSPMARFEATMALSRAQRGGQATPDAIRKAGALVDALLADLAEDVSLDSEIGDRAIEAGATYGKVVGHPANLNLGDCFAYACAKARDVPLLYKGDDFALTDLA